MGSFQPDRAAANVLLAEMRAKIKRACIGGVGKRGLKNG
jgi:hypothetical protein